MKKLVLIMGIVALGFFIFSGIALAADKFAYIDLSRTFNEYGKTKEYDKALTDKENSYINERDKKVNDIKALQEKFNLLSDKEKDSKKSELENKIKILKDFVTQREGDLRKEQETKMKEILKDIQDAVKVYSEKEGFTMVFNDRVLVYQNKSLEISDRIIDILNKRR